MEKSKALTPAMLALLWSCTTLCAVQNEPGKTAEPALPQEAAEAKPDGDATGAVSARTSALRDLALEACAASGLPQVYEYGLDQSIPPVSYEEAMSKDIGVLPWQRIRQMNQLHKDLEKRVRMSDEQKEILRRRFHQVYATMIEHPMRSVWKEFNYPPLKPEERKGLEEEVAQAEAKGEKAKADALRMIILQGTFGTEQNLSPPIEINIQVMKDKMDADQQEVFEKVFNRWHQLEFRGPMDAPHRMLLRAIKDPDLQLDPSFLNTAEAKIMDKVAALPPPPERRQHLAKAAEELKSELLPQLPPEKRAAVENTYAYLLSERQALDAYTKEMIKKRGGKTGSRTH